LRGEREDLGIPVDDWKQVIDINLIGIFHVGPSVVPQMLQKNYGRIVNVASIAGKKDPNASAYRRVEGRRNASDESWAKKQPRRRFAVTAYPRRGPTRLFDQ